MSKDWSNHRYLDKYRSSKTGKWVYVYANDAKKHNVTITDKYGKKKKISASPIVKSHSRNGMTDEERRQDDRRHRSYNKKRAKVHAKRIASNIGKAAKTVVTDRKKAKKYLSRSGKHSLKFLRNTHNIVTSMAGKTGKMTKTKSWLEKKIYGR